MAAPGWRTAAAPAVVACAAGLSDGAPVKPTFLHSVGNAVRPSLNRGGLRPVVHVHFQIATLARSVLVCIADALRSSRHLAFGRRLRCIARDRARQCSHPPSLAALESQRTLPRPAGQARQHPQALEGGGGQCLVVRVVPTRCPYNAREFIDTIKEG